MRKPALFLRSSAAIALASCSAAVSPVAAGAPPDPSAGTRVPLTSVYRACDFSYLGPTNAGHVGDGQGEALVRRSGNTVVADITFLDISKPGMHFDVGIIQVPRPTSAPCGPGSPGTAYTGMDVDAGGRATIHLQDQIQSGTTGVWLKIDRPNPHSQLPAEFYTSMFVAKV